MRTATIALAVALAFGGMGKAYAASADPSTSGEAAQHPADNTGRNVRDRSGDTLTAGDQSNSKVDVEMTQKIRREVVKDSSLSTMAHNVKIISVDGVVTLRGPVKTQQEKLRIAAVAKKVAGPDRVNDHLEIAQ